MEAGWYLKTADAPEAHWWDGSQYTTHTSPLTGYPFAVHPDPLAAPAFAAPPAPSAAPEPIVAPEPEAVVEPPVEVPEELPVVDDTTANDTVVDDAVIEDTIIHEPVLDAAPLIGAPPVAEPPFTPRAPTTPQFGPPEPTAPVAQDFGPPQPTVPVVAPGERHPEYGAAQATDGTATAPRKGMNKGLLWGIIGGGALVLIIIIVLIANLLSSVFGSNPITAPIAPPVATSEPSESADPGDAVELPDDTDAGLSRDVTPETRTVFAGLVTASIPTLANESEDSLVAGGLAVCEMFDDGADLASVSAILVQSGLDENEAALFTGYSIAMICPKYTDLVGG